MDCLRNRSACDESAARNILEPSMCFRWATDVRRASRSPRPSPFLAFSLAHQATTVTPSTYIPSRPPAHTRLFVYATNAPPMVWYLTCIPRPPRYLDCKRSGRCARNAVVGVHGAQPVDRTWTRGVRTPRSPFVKWVMGDQAAEQVGVIDVRDIDV